MADSPKDDGAQPRGGSWDVSQWLVQELAPPARPPGDAAQSARNPGSNFVRDIPPAPLESGDQRPLVLDLPPGAGVANAAGRARQPVPEINRNFARRPLRDSVEQPQPKAAEDLPQPRTRSSYGLLILLVVVLMVPALLFVAFENRPQPVAANVPNVSLPGDGRPVESVPPVPAIPSAAIADSKMESAPANSAAAAVVEPPPPQPQAASADNKESNVPARAPMLVIKQSSNAINVRPDPSTRRPPVAQLDGGSQVEKVAEDGTWLKIRFNVDGAAGVGWIRKDLVE